MRHLAVYLLLVAGGNQNPCADDITSALSSVGIDADDERLSQLLADLEGKDINEIIALGTEKLLVGGASSGPVASSSAAISSGFLFFSTNIVSGNNSGM